MKATGCDRHLVQLLLAPIRRVPWLVLPGGILAAYLVNMAVPSQASTAAALGPILVPLLIASGFPATVAGAALILGASFGVTSSIPGAGHPGRGGSHPDPVRGAVDAGDSRGYRGVTDGRTGLHGDAPAGGRHPRHGPPPGDGAVLEENFRIDLFRALIPIVPIAMLLAGYLGMPGMGWLIRTPPGPEWAGLSNALPWCGRC